MKVVVAVKECCCANSEASLLFKAQQEINQHRHIDATDEVVVVCFKHSQTDSIEEFTTEHAQITRRVEVSMSDSLDAYTTAQTLLKVIRHEGPEWVIISDELSAGQAGQLLADMATESFSSVLMNTPRDEQHLLIIREQSGGAHSVLVPSQATRRKPRISPIMTNRLAVNPFLSHAF